MQKLNTQDHMNLVGMPAMCHGKWIPKFSLFVLSSLSNDIAENLVPIVIYNKTSKPIILEKGKLFSKISLLTDLPAVYKTAIQEYDSSRMDKTSNISKAN